VNLRLFFLGLLFFSLTLSAHQRSESFSKWSVIESNDSLLLSATFTVKLPVLSKIYSKDVKNWRSLATDQVLEGFVVPKTCVLDKEIESFISTQSSSFHVAWQYECKGPVTQLINNTFFDLDLSHSHIARFIRDGIEFPEMLFTASSRTKSLEENKGKEEEITSLYDYFLLGLNHISSGFDHLAFLLALILLNRNYKDLLIAITGFTLGHSLTLALGVLGMIAPMTNWVEAVIGFSIALIALEFIAKETSQVNVYLVSLSLFWAALFFIVFLTSINISFIGLIGLSLFSITYLYLVTQKEIKLSLFITTLFGLVHGFGFGGYLSQVGFQEGRLVNALLGFNLGVEAGQLLALGLFTTVMFAFNYFKILPKFPFRPLTGCLLVGLGTFWFLERSF